MDLKELYVLLKGNYKLLFNRINSDKLIEKFLMMFLKDQSFENLKTQLLNNNREQAFIEVHTLKSVCGNLGLTALYDVTSKLTDMIRAKDSNITDEVLAMFKLLEDEYQNVILWISKYFEEKGM